MGSHLKFFSKYSAVRRSSLTAMLLMAAGAANAQAVPAGTYATISDAKLRAIFGIATDDGGSIGIDTLAMNPYAPSQTLVSASVLRPTLTGSLVLGTHLYVRVDGGTRAGGSDYIFGDNGQASEGGTFPATQPVSGTNFLKFVWTTANAANTVSLTKPDPKIQITMTLTLINDTVRLQFDVLNSSNRSHQVQLALIEDINAIKNTTDGTSVPFDTPFRIPNAPYVKTDTLFSGGQIPSYFEVDNTLTDAAAATPASLSTFRQPLLPLSGISEPTPPIQVGFGDLANLNGTYSAATPATRYNTLWSFMSSASSTLTGTAATANFAGAGLYYGLQTIAPSQSVPYIVYLGQGDSVNDLRPPLALSVSALPTLQYNKGAANPVSFPITAYVENLTNTTAGSAVTLNNLDNSGNPRRDSSGNLLYTLRLTLPAGLKADITTPLTQQLPNTAAGATASVTWNVSVDSSAAGFAPGAYNYTVTATEYNPNAVTTNITRAVTGTIQLPGPLNFTLPGTQGKYNQFRMVSFPFSTQGQAPSSALRLAGLSLTLNPNNFNLLKYDPVTQRYIAPASLEQGVGYWLRLNTYNDAKISVDSTKFSPASAASVSVTYPQGWNIIGNPYPYSIHFSEVQAAGPSGTAYPIDQAINTQNLISPTLYRFDTSDTNQNNWHYVVPVNLGFTLKPFDAYWIYVKSATVTLIYPFPDAPLAKITP